MYPSILLATTTRWYRKNRGEWITHSTTLSTKTIVLKSTPSSPLGVYMKRYVWKLLKLWKNQTTEQMNLMLVLWASYLSDEDYEWIPVDRYGLDRVGTTWCCSRRSLYTLWELELTMDNVKRSGTNLTTRMYYHIDIAKWRKREIGPTVKLILLERNNSQMRWLATRVKTLNQENPQMTTGPNAEMEECKNSNVNTMRWCPLVSTTGRLCETITYCASFSFILVWKKISIWNGGSGRKLGKQRADSW